MKKFLKTSPYKLGDRNGNFRLAKQERLEPRFWRDTWVLDPIVTLSPDTVIHNAFKGVASQSATKSTSPDNATSEFTDAEYANVQTEDGVVTSHTATATRAPRSANVAHKFTFDTSSYSNITDITCIWKGGYSDMEPAIRNLQVYKATAWEQWATITNVNTEYTKSLGNGSAYFYSGTWIKFGVYMVRGYIDEPITITLNSDYAALQITYEVAVAPIIIGDGLTWIINLLKLEKFINVVFRTASSKDVRVTT